MRGKGCNWKGQSGNNMAFVDIIIDMFNFIHWDGMCLVTIF